MTWKEKVDANKRFLDTLPIDEIYREYECDTIEELKDSIENYIDNHDIELPKILRGLTFSYLDSYDLIDYLHLRYSNFFYEEEMIYHIQFC